MNNRSATLSADRLSANMVKYSHSENRKKVCAVCCNSRGNKAVRMINSREEMIVSEKVLHGYNKDNPYLPSGMCKGCIFDMKCLSENKNVKIHFPDSYNGGIQRQTRSSESCSCKWCWLARLNGKEFVSWQKEMKGNVKAPVLRLCQSCFTGIQKGSKHQCSPSALLAVQNLSASLPKSIKEKLALETIKEKIAEVGGGGDVLLPQAKGGHNVQVSIGASSSDTKVITCKEVLTISASANLTGRQTNSVLADLRAVLGRKVIEAGVKEERPVHNKQFIEFFTSDLISFQNSKKETIQKRLFWCKDINGFLKEVSKKRGKQLEDYVVKIGADSGKGFFKVTASLYTHNKVEDS